MKHFPYPDHKLKNLKEVREHFEQLFANALSHLCIDGYRSWVLIPGDESFYEEKEAGFCITVKHPYKSFRVSVQQCTIDRALKSPPNSPFFENTEYGVFHECIHILTWASVELARRRYVTPTNIDETDETLVDHLAKVITDLVQKNRILKKRKK